MTADITQRERAYYDASVYVGTDWASGLSVAHLAIMAGLQPIDRVLEIGCGCLHTAVPIVQYLTPGSYHGLDPNRWLRDATRDAYPPVQELLVDSIALFDDRDDFDGRAAFGHRFDFIVAHSIVNHCSADQLVCLFGRIADAMDDGATALLSFIAGPHNQHGERWTYPSWVTTPVRDLDALARRFGLEFTLRPMYRLHHLRVRPVESHQWFTLRVPLTDGSGVDGDADHRRVPGFDPAVRTAGGHRGVA